MTASELRSSLIQQKRLSSNVKALPQSRCTSVRSRFLNRICKVSTAHRSVPVSVMTGRTLSQLQLSYARRGYEFPPYSDLSVQPASNRVVSPPSTKWAGNESADDSSFAASDQSHVVFETSTTFDEEGILASEALDSWLEETFPTIPPQEISDDDTEMDLSDENSYGNITPFLRGNNEPRDLILSVSPIKSSATKRLSTQKRRVRFVPEVKVTEIPSFRSYSDQEKSRMWTNISILRAEARRNTIEWMWEGCKLDKVVEENEFRCDHFGNMLHPAHFQRRRI